MAAEISRRRAMQLLAVTAGAAAAVATTDDEEAGIMPAGGGAPSEGQEQPLTVYRATSASDIQQASEPGLVILTGAEPGLVYGSIMTAAKADPTYYTTDSYPIDGGSIDNRPAVVIVTGEQGGITYFGET